MRGLTIPIPQTGMSCHTANSVERKAFAGHRHCARLWIRGLKRIAVGTSACSNPAGYTALVELVSAQGSKAHQLIQLTHMVLVVTLHCYKVAHVQHWERSMMNSRAVICVVDVPVYVPHMNQ